MIRITILIILLSTSPFEGHAETPGVGAPKSIREWFDGNPPPKYVRDWVRISVFGDINSVIPVVWVSPYDWNINGFTERRINLDRRNYISLKNKLLSMSCDKRPESGKYFRMSVFPKIRNKTCWIGIVKGCNFLSFSENKYNLRSRKPNGESWKELIEAVGCHNQMTGIH